MDTEIVGKIIKQYRENKRLSQEVLSGLASVDRSHLSKIELGVRSPTISILYKLAEAMEINASDLLRAVEFEEGKLKAKALGDLQDKMKTG